MAKIQTIKAEIYFDGEYYCVRCLNIDVFTQGKTLDAAVKNLREAVSLHLEDEEWKEYDLSERPLILAMMEVGVYDAVPNHREIAKGTLNDILNRVSERNQISKDDLINMLR